VPSASSASTAATLSRIQRVQQRTGAHRRAVVPATGAPWCFEYVSLADAHNEEMEIAVNRAAEQRFWAKVDSSAGPDGCWPWVGSVDSDGYGPAYVGARTVLAHRQAFLLAHGPIPAGRVVGHTCRSPGCCNPAHPKALTRKEVAEEAVRLARCRLFTANHADRVSA
jgi:HNH endonuclease